MDNQARKINFVQEFLQVERNKKLEKELCPMTLKEFNEIIDKSEEDFNNGRVTEARNLLNQVDKCK